MCLGLSHLPKCPFQDHFLKKSLWAKYCGHLAYEMQPHSIVLGNLAWFLLLKEYYEWSVSHVFERNKLISWDVPGFTQTTIEKSPADHLKNQSALTLYNSFFLDWSGPTELKIGLAVAPSSCPGCSLKFLVSHQSPSVTGFAWATAHF